MHPNMYFPPRRPIRPESHANINIPRCPNKWGFVFVISHCGNSSVTSSAFVCVNPLPSPVELWTLMIWVCLEFWGWFLLLHVARRGSLMSLSFQLDQDKIVHSFTFMSHSDVHDVLHIPVATCLLLWILMLWTRIDRFDDFDLRPHSTYRLWTMQGGASDRWGK